MTEDEKEFRSVFAELSRTGSIVKPRGMLVLESENFNYTLAPYVRFCNFSCRKLNLNYIKREFLWYLRGEKMDDSITRHAKMWKDLVNEDGSINSNYGQYIFGEENQFDNVLHVLQNDKDSRRASIAILSKSHLLSSTKDVPCTYAINFRIRNDALNMTVRMRSQDAIFGMGNDAPAFSFVHEMMLNALREKYPELTYGTYYHSVDSFHVYEKHFEMFKSFIKDFYTPVLCPKISGADEVRFLRANNFETIPDTFQFAKWLNTFDE